MRNIDSLLKDMIQAIVNEADPDRIYLFGSAARGVEHADSDVDLLVVEHQPFDRERTRSSELRKIRRALSAFRIPKDVLLYSRDEVAKWQHSPNHVIGRCMKEGKLVYERH